MSTSQHTIHSSCGKYSRNVWLLSPPNGKADHVAIFLDGEFYVNHMNSPVVIRDMQTKGSIPNLACLFISHIDGAHRHQDLTCSEDYANFIVHDLLAWMFERYPEASQSNCLIGGASLSGLEAAYTALQYTNIFKFCLSQSGSFWWNSEWLTDHLKNIDRIDTRFWSSVGDKETDKGVSHPPSGLRQEVTQVDACSRFAKALDKKRVPVHHHLYRGGHECPSWAAELPDALSWLLNPSQTDLENKAAHTNPLPAQS